MKLYSNGYRCGSERGWIKFKGRGLKRLYFDNSTSLINVTCQGLILLVCEHSRSRITETEGIEKL